MLKSIMALPGLTVINNSSYGPGVTGSTRWNGNNQILEVMDGLNWQPINMEFASIGLDHATQTVIDWAKKKMEEEKKIEELCAEHPGLKELKEKFDMYKILVTQEEQK